MKDLSLPANSVDPMIKATDLSLRFQDKVIFKNLTFSIAQKSRVGFLGPSGCGKSSLLRLISGLIAPTSGELDVNEQDSLSYVFQEPSLLPWLTAAENVALSLRGQSVSAAQVQDRVHGALETVRLWEHQAKFPHQLSGGMRMRVSFARAMVRSPRLLLLDEPFAALDENSRWDLQDWLLTWLNKSQATLVLVTHSLTEASYLCNLVFPLSGEPAQLTNEIRFSESAVARDSDEYKLRVQAIRESLVRR